MMKDIIDNELMTTKFKEHFDKGLAYFHLSEYKSATLKWKCQGKVYEIKITLKGEEV